MQSSRPSSATLVFAVLAALAAVVVGSLLTTDANLDWDTYSRIAFMRVYDPRYGGDTHVLYHRVLWIIRDLGVPPQAGVFGLTAASYGLFLLTVDWVGRARGLSVTQRAVVFGLALLCSPGIWTMTWMAEDNVAYLAPVLGFLHLVTSDCETPLDEVWRGITAGVLLGLALLINITVLIFFVIGPVGLVAWVIGRRAEATRALVTIGACLLTYYGFHAVSGYGADIALHEYLIKAASLEDFGEDTAPTLSWLRVQQFGWGARAMFLTPGIYRMDLPTDLDTIVRGVLPIVVLGLYVALALWTLRKRQGGEATVWPLLPASVVGVSVAFPYFYEPLLIERWDLFWLCHVLGCIALLRSRPRMGVEVLLAILVLIELGYTALVFRHHFAGEFLQQVDRDTVEIIDEIQLRKPDAIVFEASVDPTQLARVAHAAPGVPFMLVGQQDGQLRCARLMSWLDRRDVACSRLGPTLGGLDVYIHWDAEALMNRLMKPDNP